MSECGERATKRHKPGTPEAKEDDDSPKVTPLPMPEVTRLLKGCSIPEFKPENVEWVEVGRKGTLAYKMFFEYNGHRISPWHDIPLYANKQRTRVNFICEIPKGTAAKFEISRTIAGNPIIQDRSLNKETGEEEPRSYQWPEAEPQMFWNYGALPQTWEDPGHEEKDISLNGSHPRGDNDPIDAIVIGKRSMETGEVCAVKILGVLALIDDGETDWKLICADVSDNTFENINTLEELLEVKKYHSEVKEISSWLRDYKQISKNITNYLHWNGAARDEKYAMSKVRQTHEFWVQHTQLGLRNRELKD